MNAYYDDEYEYEDSDYDDDCYYDEVTETLLCAYLGKAKNGHLYTQYVYGWKYAGQDWGETAGQWQVNTYRLSDIESWIRDLAIEHGRNLKPGELIEFRYWTYGNGDEFEGEQDHVS